MFQYLNGIALGYDLIRLDTEYTQGLLEEVRARQLAAMR